MRHINIILGSYLLALELTSSVLAKGPNTNPQSLVAVPRTPLSAKEIAEQSAQIYKYLEEKYKEQYETLEQFKQENDAKYEAWKNATPELRQEVPSEDNTNNVKAKHLEKSTAKSNTKGINQKETKNKRQKSEPTKASKTANKPDPQQQLDRLLNHTTFYVEDFQIWELDESIDDFKTISTSEFNGEVYFSPGAIGFYDYNDNLTVAFEIYDIELSGDELANGRYSYKFHCAMYTAEEVDSDIVKPATWELVMEFSDTDYHKIYTYVPKQGIVGVYHLPAGVGL